MAHHNPYRRSRRSTRRKPPTTSGPETIARCLRSISEFRISKTWDDYFSDRQRNALNAWEALCFMREQFPDETHERLEAALVEVIPELFSEYWERLNEALKTAAA